MRKTFIALAWILLWVLPVSIYGSQQDQQIRELADQVLGKSCKYKNGVDSCVQRSLWDGLSRRHDKEYCIIDAARCLGEIGESAKPAIPVLVQVLQKYRNIETGDGIAASFL